MGNKLSLFEKRMININGDLQERVIYQRHMADDLFWAASGIVEKWIEIWASGIISEDYILTSPAKQVTSPHYSYSLDVDVIPDASGIRSLGSVDIPWTSGAFDELYVPSIINDVDVYGNVNVHGTIRQINYDEYDVIELNVSGDTKLGDGTDDTIDLVGTIISSSGNILINDSINPIASGTMDLGTISLAFDEAYIDKVYLEKDPVDPLGATTKQYVDAAVEVESFWDRAGTTIYPHNSGDDITTTGGIIIDSDSNGLYLGDELDGSITFNGNGLIIQSDGIAAGDYLQLRGGTNGIDFKIGGTEQLTLTDGALTPTASGTMNLGTVSLAYDDAYIDKVYLEDDPTTPLQAATKQYVDAAMASASPGGVDTNVQYNNSGILDGAADLTYNNVTSILTAIGFSGPLTGNSTTVTNGVYTTDFPLNQDTTGKADTAGNADTVTTNANLTGGVTSVGNAATVVTNANLTGGVTSVGNAATVVTNANLTGEVTSVGNAATIADSVTVTGWTMGTFSGTTYTGAVTGNCSGSSGSCTGLAATATALATGRTIGGVTFDGTANIVPTTIAVTDTADASCYIGLWESASGDLLPQTDTGITYNASTGMLTATGLTGPLTGNADTVTTNANLTGIVTSVGNATAIADKAITIAKLADGTDGELITWDAAGVIATVITGIANQVLTSNGPDTAPTFQASSAEVDTLQSVTDRGTTTSNVITPDASGTINLGTVVLAFDNAYIDKVHLEGNPTTSLQAATKQYVDAAMASATPAGSDTQVQYNNGGVMGGAAGLIYNDGTQDVTFGNDLLVTASGTQDLGTIALAFNDAYIDKVYLEANPTTPFQAATKQYVDDNSGGGGSPGGSDTQIQFNDGGSFSGDSDLTWNKSTNRMTVNGDIIANETITYDTEYNNGNSGASITVDWNNGNKQMVTMTANCTIGFTAPPGPSNLVLRLVQDAGGTNTIAITGALWPDGDTPTFSTGGDDVDIVSIYYNGTNYYCQTGLNFG